jgi:C1A family cysteine protease
MQSNVTIEKCIRLLDTNGAIILTFECFETIYEAPRGRIELPKAGEKKVGSHCVAVYDYSSDEQCFYFKNSWGDKWGDRGHGSLPFAYIEHGHVTELATLL